MTDYEAIYRDHADAYDRMVRAEDCDGALARALADVGALDGKTAVEIGVGTGRITELLVAAGCHVIGFERAAAMLEVAKRRLGDRASCELSLGDARSLPVSDGTADLAVSGWVLGHMTHWEGERWQQAVEVSVGELSRVVKPGGKVIIFETLGSGTEEAAPPNDKLAAYYALLEERGFERTVLRTDYQFASVEDAVEATTFFFGEAFAENVRDHGWARIPEHTGMWVLTV